jgi:PhzF family phenazine biosynthesis protein
MRSYIVDSFTTTAFAGNPAAVCFVEKALSDDNMLHIAQEFGLSDTAFITTTNDRGIYGIRYFSPKQEIPLCGHATLAAAKVIFSREDFTAIHFITGEGLDLPILRRDEEMTMTFPVYDTTDIAVPPAVPAALGIRDLLQTAYCVQLRIILLELSDAAELAALQPDYGALLQSYAGIKGVLVTAPAANTEYDFHYRYFWPWSGTNEDPVTGGVQTFLAKYWGNKLGKQKMKAFQSSARSGFMTVELVGEKVLVTGQAVIVLAGELWQTGQ